MKDSAAASDIRFPYYHGITEATISSYPFSDVEMRSHFDAALLRRPDPVVTEHHEQPKDWHYEWGSEWNNEWRILT